MGTAVQIKPNAQEQHRSSLNASQTRKTLQGSSCNRPREQDGDCVTYDCRSPIPIILLCSQTTQARRRQRRTTSTWCRRARTRRPASPGSACATATAATISCSRSGSPTAPSSSPPASPSRCVRCRTARRAQRDRLTCSCTAFLVSQCHFRLHKGVQTRSEAGPPWSTYLERRPSAGRCVRPGRPDGAGLRNWPFGFGCLKAKRRTQQLSKRRSACAYWGA